MAGADALADTADPADTARRLPNSGEPESRASGPKHSGRRHTARRVATRWNSEALGGHAADGTPARPGRMLYSMAQHAEHPAGQATRREAGCTHIRLIQADYSQGKHEMFVACFAVHAAKTSARAAPVCRASTGPNRPTNPIAGRLVSTPNTGTYARCTPMHQTILPLPLSPVQSSAPHIVGNQCMAHACRASMDMHGSSTRTGRASNAGPPWS